MKFLLSGYFGFDNTGDEAVLAAMLGHLRAQMPAATYCALSGNPENTRQNHGIEAIGRQSPREIAAAFKNCDALISGGGSLVQDVTSLRNAIYYTGLIRMARLMKKPAMIYAQGVGPLHRSISRKLTRAAFGTAQIITVRDEASKELLQKIGVQKPIEVTADPVWALDERPAKTERKVWIVALRSWPGEDESAMARIVGALRALANAKSVKLQFLPMQPEPDEAVLKGLVGPDEILSVRGKSPREVQELACGGQILIAMRLHALIFAASRGVPVVAFDYDPKVAALAKLWGAPLLKDSTLNELKKLPDALKNAQAPNNELLKDLQNKARRNAELAAQL